MDQVRVSQKIIRKMRDMAIRQAITEIKDIDDKPNVEYIAKRHGLKYKELLQAYMRANKNG